MNDVRDAETKARLLAEAEAAVAHVERGCNLLVGVELIEGLTEADREIWKAELLIEHTAKETLTSDKAQRALAAAHKHDAFHWFLEFPEVFEGLQNPGGNQIRLSHVVGNPPFIGGTRISTRLGADYLMVYRIDMRVSATVRICAVFFSCEHLRSSGFWQPGTCCHQYYSSGRYRVSRG